LHHLGLENYTIIRLCDHEKNKERWSLKIASQVGGLFLDRLPGGLWITPSPEREVLEALELSRNVLQSSGVRRYKAEFISCPGCGRTLFDLQSAVAKVKQAFGHLNSLKIAVMGCIVNGPGEMGDADFGYVGAGNGKVNLYRGREMVRTAIPEEEAIEALRQLIDGDLNNKE
jgi:(E)-4-hydroxy-3-methylbut-2-enyl-diphosphate synthase